MSASKQQGFLGAVTMVTAAGVWQVQSPFSAIPPPAFPSWGQIAAIAAGAVRQRAADDHWHSSRLD